MRTHQEYGLPYPIQLFRAPGDIYIHAGSSDGSGRKHRADRHPDHIYDFLPVLLRGMDCLYHAKPV
ncbi:hypothetical protein D3C86_2243990 [compost metagenome]